MGKNQETGFIHGLMGLFTKVSSQMVVLMVVERSQIALKNINIKVTTQMESNVEKVNGEVRLIRLFMKVIQ